MSGPVIFFPHARHSGEEFSMILLTSLSLRHCRTSLCHIKSLQRPDGRGKPSSLLVRDWDAWGHSQAQPPPEQQPAAAGGPAATDDGGGQARRNRCDEASWRKPCADLPVWCFKWWTKRKRVGWWSQHKWPQRSDCAPVLGQEDPRAWWWRRFVPRWP